MEQGIVFIAGMMGVGKTVVAECLGDRLGRRVVDTDALVEEAAGRRIAEIWESEGEAAFRKRERDAIDALAGSGCIAALGGGAMAQPGMPERLATLGTVVVLRASPATLAARIGADRERPLLAGLDATAREERLAELLRLRQPAYARAHHQIDTEGRTVDAVADEVLARLGEAAP